MTDNVQLEARDGPRQQYKAPHNSIYTLTSGLPSDVGGFNRLILAFWTTAGLVGAAAEWANLSAADRAARLDAYHKDGVAVLIAAFGANDIPTAQDPGAIATQLADYVNTYGLDGVDIDYEDTQALYGGTGATWVSELTRQLRNKLPDKFISHAPQEPYFKAGGGYDQVDKTVGNYIDFYNVQFYNQGGDEGCSGSLARLNQIISSGVPADKVVFGKPLTSVDGSSGWMSGSEIYQCLKNKPAGWTTQVMFWQFHEGVAASTLATITTGVGSSGDDNNDGVTATPTTVPEQTYNTGTPTTSTIPFWQTGRWKRERD
jgi:chitinase